MRFLTEKEYNYILTIAEYGNITKAAEQLFIAQPSLTQSLHRIEEDYGAKFFYRGHDGVRLTEAGRAYLAAAERMLALYGELRERVSTGKGSEGGKLTLGLEGFQAEYLLADLMGTYEKKYPGMELRMVESTSSQLQRMVKEKKLDLALLHYPFLNEGVGYVSLYDDELVLAVAKEHEGWKRMAAEQGLCPVITKELLKTQPFVMLTSSQQLRILAEHICSVAGVEPEVKYTTMSLGTAMSLASRNVGVVVAPMTMFRFYSQMYALHCFRFPESWNASWKLVAAYESDTILTQDCFNLIDVLRECLGGME